MDIEPGWPYGKSGKRPITDPEMPVKKKPRRRNRRKILLWLVAIIFALACIATVGYFVKRNNDLQKENERLSNPEEVVKNQQDELVATVGKIVDLPTEESPTIATVNDLEKLQSQEFFVNAAVGDKVLVYTQAKKAYLYRPSTNKIINIAPVNLGDQ